jgi:hypothetical protein
MIDVYILQFGILSFDISDCDKKRSTNFLETRLVPFYQGDQIGQLFTFGQVF